MIKAAILGSIMIIVILVLRRVLGKRLPRFSFKLLWMLAAIRLVLPFGFDVEVEVPAFLKADKVQPAVIISAENAEMSDESDMPAVPEHRATVLSADVFRIIHILGALILGGFMFSAYIRMRRLALRAKPVEIGGGIIPPGVSVFCGDSFTVPFSCGVIKPIIFIPSAMMTLDRRRIDVIIAHEASHIRCLDQAVKWLFIAAVCLNWYNPLCWVMLHFANRDVELACDEAVVRKLGERADYAMTLIEAEEARGTAAVCSFGAPSLNERIEFIMKSKKTTMIGFLSAGVILVLMTVFFVSVNAVNNDADNEKGTSGQPGEAAGTETVTPSEDIEYPIIEAEADENSTAAQREYPEDVTEYEATAEANEQAEYPSIELHCPLSEHGAVTQKFGYQTSPIGLTVFNNGINVAAPAGTEVRAAASGTVVYAQYSNELGNSVTVEHEDGYVTVYGHLDEIACAVGDRVSSGERLGTVGQTGMATGPNLFFSARHEGGFFDPTTLFE